MRIHNVSIVGDTGAKDILLDRERIACVDAAGAHTITSSNEITFDNAIAFPGLINSHDHLDFDLFPPIANRIYRNYREWGNDIHANNREQIWSVLQVPQATRTRWGMYRNLLNGFTTVVNHGEPLAVGNDLVTVWQSPGSIHSVGFEKRWQWRLNKVPSKKIYNIHVGEGTDTVASAEINSLIRWNLFRRKIVAVHGVAMTEKQAASFSGLVWCPASNNFLLGQTAPVDRLKERTSILFGSDSTLTAGWDIWEQLQTAQQSKMLSDEELYEAITMQPARVWGMPKAGRIAAGYLSDIVVARKQRENTLDSFFATTPQDILLVIHRGRIRLFDGSLQEQLNWIDQHDFVKLSIGGTTKYVYGDIDTIIKEIKQYLPQKELPVTLL